MRTTNVAATNDKNLSFEEKYAGIVSEAVLICNSSLPSTALFAKEAGVSGLSQKPAAEFSC